MKFYHVLLWHQCTLCVIVAGWSSPVARQAHNLKVVGSNPTPATNINDTKSIGYRFLRFRAYFHHRIIAAFIAAFAWCLAAFNYYIRLIIARCGHFSFLHPQPVQFLIW